MNLLQAVQFVCVLEMITPRRLRLHSEITDGAECKTSNFRNNITQIAVHDFLRHSNLARRIYFV